VTDPGTTHASVPIEGHWVNVPNGLTALRMLLVPVFAWVLLSHPHDDSWRWMAALIFVVASITDIVDGKVARKYGLVTRFGKLWDPIADKALTGMALVGLSIIGELAWWITIVILIREWGITLLRFLILKYGVMAANRGGKLKTVMQSIAIVMYLLPLPTWLHIVGVGVMWIALILTVLTGLDYCWEAYRLRKKALAGEHG
jgi:CDP-diacylglycerol---glycerol-3-phosphate 3-phosphatidyltransferase